MQVVIFGVGIILACILIGVRPKISKVVYKSVSAVFYAVVHILYDIHTCECAVIQWHRFLVIVSCVEQEYTGEHAFCYPVVSAAERGWVRRAVLCFRQTLYGCLHVRAYLCIELLFCGTWLVLYFSGGHERHSAEHLA